MFTGLIRHNGELKAQDSRGLTVACPSLKPQLAAGDSVAVNGACLTVAELTGEGFRADLLEDTRRNTTLGELPISARLNLETALTAGEAFGGHFVQGHVDGIAHITARRELPTGNWRLDCELPEWLKPHVIDRGSIAIDGVSLTVQEIDAAGSPPSFSVAIIPTTWAETNLGGLSIGAKVNIEADMLIKAARHSIEQILGQGEMLTADKLREWGYGK